MLTTGRWLAIEHHVDCIHQSAGITRAVAVRSVAAWAVAARVVAWHRRGVMGVAARGAAVERRLLHATEPREKHEIEVSA